MNGRTWLACDMDDGVLRRSATKGELLRWWLGLQGETAATEIHRYGPGEYEYIIRDADSDLSQSIWIMRASVAAAAAFDPDQRPLFPFDDDPYEYLERSDGEVNGG